MMDKIPDEYKIFTQGPVGGVSYVISSDFPIVKKYERLITHDFLCTHCDPNAYVYLVKQFVDEYNIDQPLINNKTVWDYALFYNDIPSIEFLSSIQND
jgi:hypothetical protein